MSFSIFYSKSIRQCCTISMKLYLQFSTNEFGKCILPFLLNSFSSIFITTLKPPLYSILSLSSLASHHATSHHIVSYYITLHHTRYATATLPNAHMIVDDHEISKLTLLIVVDLVNNMQIILCVCKTERDIHERNSWTYLPANVCTCDVSLNRDN